MNIKSAHPFSIKGEVIQILEKDNKLIAKITNEGIMLEIPINDREFVHLGDHLKVKGKLLIEDVTRDLNNETEQTTFS